MNTHQKLAIKALEQMKGDDLMRAKNAFRNCTSEQMKEKYGQSGKTRAEIISSYESHNAKIDAAIAWVKDQN